jgi:hypothetical protein
MFDETPESAMELLCQEEIGVVRVSFPSFGKDRHCTGKLVVYLYRNSDVNPPEEMPAILAGYCTPYAPEEYALLAVEDIRDQAKAIPGRVVIALPELSEDLTLQFGRLLVAMAKSSPRSIELAEMDLDELGDPREN